MTSAFIWHHIWWRLRNNKKNLLVRARKHILPETRHIAMSRTLKLSTRASNAQVHITVKFRRDRSKIDRNITKSRFLGICSESKKCRLLGTFPSLDQAIWAIFIKTSRNRIADISRHTRLVIFLVRTANRGSWSSLSVKSFGPTVLP